MAESKIKLTQTKFLFTSFTVDREEDGEIVRRKLPANTTQKLTDDEVKLLDNLTEKTGRAHYREPISERTIEADDGDDLVLTSRGAKTADDKTAEEAGLTGKPVPTDEQIDGYSVKDLKAYLDAEPAADYAASDDKAALQSKAKSKASTARAAADADNSGL